MIIREWRGRTEPVRADAYVHHFRNVVEPELRRIPGFLGAWLTRRMLGEILEYVVITRWESMDAIRAFAGATADRAIVEPGAVAALSSYDSTVRHYEVIEEVTNE